MGAVFRGLVAAAFCVVCLTAQGCGRAGERAEAGGTADAEVRIAVLSPAIAVALDAIGAGDLIVARHGYDVFTDPGVPVAGDQGGIDYEALRRARPTVVLLEWGVRPLPDRLLELAAAEGWRIESFRLLTASDIAAATLEVGEVTGRAAAREEAARLVAEFEAAMAPSPDVAARAGRCLVLFSVSPPAAAGPGSVHYEILERMGLPHAIRSGGPYIELDPEGLRRLAPDSIVLLAPGGSETDAKAAKGRLTGLGLAAARDGRVLVVVDPLCQTPTIRLGALAAEFRKVVGDWPPLLSDK